MKPFFFFYVCKRFNWVAWDCSKFFSPCNFLSEIRSEINYTEKHREASFPLVKHSRVRSSNFSFAPSFHQYLPLDNFPRPKGSTPPPFSQTTNYLALKSAFQTNRESKITRVTRKFFFFFIERIYSYSCFDSYTELIYLIYLVRRKDLFKIEYPFSAYLFKRLSKLQNVWQQTIRIENSSPTIP